MRRFANFYIVLFLIDAGLSLIDELSTVFAAHLPILSMVRNFVAFLVIVLSLVIYFLLGLDRRLPKRVNGVRLDLLTFAYINHPWQENHAFTIPALSTMSFFAST
jgi:hypothetical protein